MQNTVQSFVDGMFEGWDPATVYVLEDGSTWKLARPIYLELYLFRPQATVFVDNDRHYMLIGLSKWPVEVVCLSGPDKNHTPKMAKRPDNLDAIIAEMQRY